MCILCRGNYPNVYFSFGNESHNFEFWGNALKIMNYHRNKMNEYLCKNYIASEIIEGYKNLSLSKSDITKRNGKSPRQKRLARESLLTDPGSRKYQDWLSRSSTLEDIYNQFEHSEEGSAGHGEVEHDDGGVTGYALVDSKHIYAKPIEHEPEHHFVGYHDDSHYHSHYHHEHEDEKEDEEKGLKLKELFHFALTAIAFLAFATFMIEVLMSLMEIPSSDTDYVLVPTNSDNTAAASKIDETTPLSSRKTRSLINDDDPTSIEILNIISSKVLLSIETLVLMKKDNGECFQRSLCQNVKYSKTLPGSQKIWLPIWSFGISWIGNRLSRKNNSTSFSNNLKYIKAAVMGLGSKDCHVLHPKCDEKLRRRTRTKRKER